MSLTTPTTAEISAIILAQLDASLGQAVPLLPKAFRRVLAKVLGGVFILLYKYGGHIFLQQFVQTADNADTVILGRVVNPLQFWGALVGVGAPTAATFAELVVDITVTATGETLPAGTQFVSSANGVTYISLTAVSLDAATVQTTVRAAADQSGGGGAGTVANLDVGAELTFAKTRADVVRTVTVASVGVTAADGESTEAYRARVFDRFQKPPQGGAYADYEQWGEEAAGIVNVYPYTGAPGQVDVYSEATVASSGSADGIPTAAQLQAVLDIINLDADGLASRRNAGAFVNSYPITRTGFDVVVTGISGVDDLAQVRLDIEAAAAEYFAAVEPFIAGLSVPPRNDQITRTRLSALVEDIVTAAGGTFTSAAFTLTGGGGQLSAYVLGEGEKAKLVLMSYA